MHHITMPDDHKELDDLLNPRIQKTKIYSFDETRKLVTLIKDQAYHDGWEDGFAAGLEDPSIDKQCEEAREEGRQLERERILQLLEQERLDGHFPLYSDDIERIFDSQIQEALDIKEDK